MEHVPMSENLHSLLPLGKTIESVELLMNQRFVKELKLICKQYNN